MWDHRDLLRIATEGLQAKAHAIEAEQSAYGLESLAELEFHPILAHAFSAAGLGVRREWPYPGVPEKRPKFAARNRCDLVLTHEPGLHLLDPVAELLETDKAQGTLFESTPTRHPARPTTVVPAEDAYWLEVKAVGQYTYTQGIPGPNRAYGSELTQSLTIDLAKIAADQALRSSGLLLILFTDSQETADHDILVALHRALDKGLSFSAPLTERFPVPDRIGNTMCSVILVPR